MMFLRNTVLIVVILLTKSSVVEEYNEKSAITVHRVARPLYSLVLRMRTTSIDRYSRAWLASYYGTTVFR